VPTAVVDRLLGPAQLISSGNNLIILPAVEDLVAMGEADRSALYRELTKT